MQRAEIQSGMPSGSRREEIRRRGTLPIKGSYESGQMPLKPKSPSLCLTKGAQSQVSAAATAATVVPLLLLLPLLPRWFL